MVNLTSTTETDTPWLSPGTNDNIVSRMERVPFSRWQVKARVLVGTGTFFDAFDALAIAQVMPVLSKMWHLSSGQISMLIAIGYLGQLFGALIFSQLAERKGRVIGLCASIAVFSLCSLAAVFSPSYGVFMLFRFLQGLGLGGEVPIGATYVNEITKAHGRGRFVLLFELIFSFGVVLAALAGRWIVPNLGWHYMYIIGCLPILIIPVLLIWLPESPRWLAQSGRASDADAAMTRIEEGVANAIGQPLPAPTPLPNSISTAKGKVSELFSPAYRTRTITVWVIWFATYLVYYGIGTWLPSLYSGQYHLPLGKSLSYAMVGNVCALIGAAICAFTIDLLGRKKIFMWSLIMSALMLVILALTGAHEAEDVLVWGSLAWLFAGANSVGLYLYTPEIYPTRVRSIGVGVATASMRLASILGPLIIGTLIPYGLPAISIVFAVVAIIAAAVVAKWAIETRQKILEEISK